MHFCPSFLQMIGIKGGPQGYENPKWTIIVRSLNSRRMHEIPSLTTDFRASGMEVEAKEVSPGKGSIGPNLGAELGKGDSLCKRIKVQASIYQACATALAVHCVT